MKISPTIFLIVTVFAMASCDQSNREINALKSQQKEQLTTLFTSLSAQQTGINFTNQVTDRQDFNVLLYRNYYNGGGVAIGDINNDGLADLYFTANLTPNKLYLNKGGFQFEDITDKAGTAGTKAWSTGVTMADVNGDGWLDIYVSNSGDIDGDNKANELFINNGDLTFTESAQAYGLANEGFSTQAAFFDYDADGDLDCYLLNNSFQDPSKIRLYENMRLKPDALGGDKLYRNDGEQFTDVTKNAGIYSSAIGFGLGAVIGDINGDTHPDIYVSNDFWERDYLYINQGNGTFKEDLINRIDICSISSMGGDMGDINNDGHPEIISTDMLAADNYRLKAMSAFDPYHLDDLEYRANYHYQFGQNCLHLNDGTGHFQEIAMMSGVAATDWSWGALFFDFENDGLKDLFISNGIQRDLMSMDFRDFMANNNMYGRNLKTEEVDFPGLTQKMPSNPIRNYAFSNQGNLQFQDQTVALGLGKNSFSNGSAYGDLDNDGDLDLVINNANSPAFIYRNEAEKTPNNYLKVKLKGPDKNPFGIGAKVIITTDNGIQTYQNFNTRGFQSSVEPFLTIGLGQTKQVKELAVYWPGQTAQFLHGVSVNQELTLSHADAGGYGPEGTGTTDFQNVTRSVLKGEAIHLENRYNDFDHEILSWYMLSTESPRIVKGDVNNDGLEDFVLLGAKNDEDKLFVQQKEGTFQRKANQGFAVSKGFESSDGVFMDVDQDGDQDLMLASGGNEYQQGGKFFILRYFENDGRGNLRVDNTNIPQVVGNFSCIKAADVDGDGDQDMFLGGRNVPGNYGLPPRSFLFLNDQGKWRDATSESLAGAGMVTDAIFADIDQDQDQDLIVVGDWTAVQIFTNENGSLNLSKSIPNSEGWWRSIQAADLDNDGDQDFVLGNWGTNSKFQASAGRPLTMYVNDFDQNKKSEFILNWYAPLDQKAYPFATKMDITEQLPGLRKQILKYEAYANETYETLFPQEIRQRALTYKAVYLKSAILWNDQPALQLQALPPAAQMAPTYAIIADDLNKDGFTDIWLGGNFYALKPQVGRLNASRGVFLAGNGSRTFTPIPHQQSGIIVEGEVRGATTVTNESR